jgi:lipoprotein-anchoring transpeptidase ErfK/SrfK
MRNIRKLMQLAVMVAAGLAAPPTIAADLVSYAGPATPGTIVVETGVRRLYLVLEHGRALRYVVGVGRAGREWTGSSRIEAKFLRPNWAPPSEIRQDRPGLPPVVAGGDPGNPMGEAAMTLAGGPYAIHGTNAPASIGGFVSYGCIRMYNADILDLFGRVHVGTRVEVVL